MEAARVEVLVFVGALILLVGYKLLTGEINTAGLLRDKDTKQFSPARAQLLVTTIFGLGFFLFKVVQEAQLQTGTLPDLPQDLVLLLGGSQTLYLGSKAAPLIRSALGLGSS